MNLILIRHAPAEDRNRFAKETGEDDGLRPLTKLGRKKMRRAAAGLLTLVPRIDALATSPLTRAEQTAEIIAEAFGGPRVTRRPELVPDKRPAQFLRWLQSHERESTVAAVGHEPHLSHSISWLMTGLEDANLRLKKGGAALLSFDKDVGPGRAVLHWLLTPAQLRRLGA